MTVTWYDQRDPRALAETLAEAARRRDFDGMVACVAPRDREGIVALSNASRAFYRRLPDLLVVIRRAFGPELARQVRERTDLPLPDPLTLRCMGHESGGLDMAIEDCGDRALYRLSGRPVAMARLIGVKWYFVAGSDEYGRAFLRKSMEVQIALMRGALDEMNGVISGVERGDLMEAEVRERMVR